ncbi:phage holin family protein [Flavobacterium ardleyense]|uniref:phage holin family protein n=1 Tax=Flavobacterium ardleyense TaxID=2038737 RepID=UPI00298CB924|nr:phage holin family protein [Flavobacterium ardleyense]
MNLVIRILVTAFIVLLLANFLGGVSVDGFGTSIIVAIVLGLLNLIVKPLMVLFTLPVTLLTLGLFLFVINAVIILLCSELVGGFHVASFWTALLFSILLSVLQSVMNGLLGESK